MKKSQAAIVGAVILTTMVLIGVLVFFGNVEKILKQEAEKIALPKLNAKAMEISDALNKIIRFRGERYIVYDIPNTVFKYYSKYNTTILAIKTEIDSDLNIVEPLGDKNYYYEVCKIQSGILVGCFLNGVNISDLSKFCHSYFSDLEKEGNILYCFNQRIYTIKTIGGNKFMISIFPTPRINIPSNNNLCNPFLVNLEGKKHIIFICDFFMIGNDCYFPNFIGSFSAFSREGEIVKVVFKYAGIKKIDNFYPFCENSYLFNIRVIKSG